MPRPTRHERLYLRLVLIAELREVAQLATEAIERHAAAVLEDGLDEDQANALYASAMELRERLEFLDSSEAAVNMASRSLS